MKRRALALCAGLVLALMPGSALAGVGTLDLSKPQNGSGPYHDSSYWAQTFTADKSGLLSEVDLWMDWSVGSHNVTIYIQATDPTGAPSGSPSANASHLASADGVVPEVAAWVPFVFSTPLDVTSGTTYAIVFVTNTGLSQTEIYGAGPYPGGKTWSYDQAWGVHDWEFAFQTWLAGATTVLPPSMSAAFAAPSMTVGQAVALTFTITNGSGNGPVTGVAFSDTLPTGLSVSNGSTSACNGGTLTRTSPSGIALSGGSLADGASCQVKAMVTGNAAGSYTITTGNVSSTEGGQGNTATASINVDAYPSIAAAFSPSSVAVGATTQLTITITNPAGNPDKLWPIDLAGTLPAGLTVASAAAVTTCGAGSLTVTAPVTIALSAASVAVGSPCVFSVPVTGAVAGTYTDTITAILGGFPYPGNTASAALGVAAAAPAPTPTPTAAPTKAPTPATTSTGAGPGSDNTGSTIWFLPFALVLFGGLLVLVDWRRRRLF